MENRVLIREFNEARDVEVVGKLEKKCEIGSKNGVALFTNMTTDPLCRIRFYAVHVMLVGLFFFLSWATAYIHAISFCNFCLHIYFYLQRTNLLSIFLRVYDCITLYS